MASVENAAGTSARSIDADVYGAVSRTSRMAPLRGLHEVHADQSREQHHASVLHFDCHLQDDLRIEGDA